MNLIVGLIAKYALWIYILCGLGMLFYLRTALAARNEGSQAIYSLERDSAASKVYRSSGMILVLLMIVVGVYALANYVELPTPVTSPVAKPTEVVESATPTRMVATPTPGEPTVTPEPTATRRPRETALALPTLVEENPTLQVLPAACPHPNVQVAQPGQNQVINEGIQVTGTAQKELFDRYEFKFQSRDLANDDWHWVETFRTPVERGNLGFWPTAHLPAGNYRFMLIVIDKTGNSEECVVPVVIRH
jgi:F0F1-type ATP synthase membrane subunit c/vacuolar-type H+-ATPase subunit K